MCSAPSRCRPWSCTRERCADEPASARKFAAAIPGAKLITYPHVGHLPQIEIPQRSAADVAAFLEAQPAARERRRVPRNVTCPQGRR